MLTTTRIGLGGALSKLLRHRFCHHRECGRAINHRFFCSPVSRETGQTNMQQYNSISQVKQLSTGSMGDFSENWRYRCKYSIDDVKPYEPHLREALASPLVQVFSISINTDFDGGRQCEIYGSVRAIDGQGTISDLYDRSVGNTETILKHGNLSLIGSHTSYLTCSEVNNTTMDLYLKDRTRNSVVIKGELDLHSKTEEIEDSCDKLITAILQGEHGLVSIYYAKFLFGVTAIVNVAFFKKRDTSCPFIDVYGSVVAEYGTARHYCSSDDEVKHLRCTLFNQPSDQPVRAMVAYPFKLSRCVVAVPAYSSLVIEANVWCPEGLFASGSVEFLAQGCSDWKQLIDGENGTILVHVRWRNAYSRFYKALGMGTRVQDIGENERVDAELKDKVVGESKGMATHNKALIPCDQQLKPKFGSLESRSFTSLPLTSGTELTEVFSVYVGCIGKEVSALCGSIVASDGISTIMYERDVSNPELLVAGKRISSIETHLIEDCNFYMKQYLKDPVNELEICNGSITWYEGVLYNIRGTHSLFDTRLCSVVRGEHGYAAVHYMIFYDACRATVDITFFFNDPSTVPANIYGSVVASYSSHDYSTHYAKTYYQSRLFERPQSEYVQLTSCSKIPLSKLTVAVPTDTSLLIEVDLRAFGDSDDVIFGKEELQIDLSKIICKEIRGRHYRVEVSAKFDDILTI